MKKLRRRKPAFNLRMFDLANDDNSQKDSLELYWDALEQTDAAYEGRDKDMYIRKDNSRHPEYYLLANIVEALYSINDTLTLIRDELERGTR